VLGFIYLPLIVLAIYAFNSSRIQVWPPTSLTLHWFFEAAANPQVVKAVTNSLLVASTATALALVLGTLAALAVQRYDFFGRQTISFFLVLPIALPGVITGIALRTTFTTFGVDLGLLTIIVGHATFCVVVVYNNVIARLRRLPRTPEEASADLGADGFTTFRRVTLPGILTALLSGGLLAFGLSFDEIIVTIFTAGAGTQTVPMWIYGAIQRPNELPVVNVVALVLIIISIVPVYIAQRLASDVTSGAGL
jgi:putative spermidine/putrescine transport system permease protein